MSVNEPKEAFPYKPPTEEIKRRYCSYFEEEFRPSLRSLKRALDIVFSLLVLIIASPLVLILVCAYAIEGLIIPRDKGWPFYYWITQGKTFAKWKVRIIKGECVDQDLAKQHDWHAFKNEWKPECRTFIGGLAKSYYFDEIPQFWSVLVGDISLVGPRPLAVHHYERDIEQGNVTRGLLRGGILGPGHTHKGTALMGVPIYEYERLHKYCEGSALDLLKQDLKKILAGANLVSRGEGL